MVRQPLALDAPNEQGQPLAVVQVASRVAEGELRAVAVQVAARDAVIDPKLLRFSATKAIVVPR